jgi:hypothetical protein
MVRKSVDPWFYFTLVYKIIEDISFDGHDDRTAIIKMYHGSDAYHNEVCLRYQ